MVENDVQLIHRILSGDDEAFNTLVRKYQKSVHALAWRKVGDFHFAEEIAQDTFLQAYKNLAMLKDPNQFGGWLYVIANRLCLKWIQRNKPAMQSLEDTSMGEVERSSYTRYISEQRETEATERRYAIVKRLLEKLPESERTVVTLYYLGEMTAKEIGKFLGVSVNTIKSRLRRARERLKNDESMIREMLGGVQLSADFTENIMQQVAEMNPTLPPVGKPLLPWAAVGVVTLLVMVLMGVGSRYVTRFQQPYSFEAQSEPTIEIVDAPVVLDIPSKPSIRNQAGRAVQGRQNSAGLQVPKTVLASDTWGDSIKSSPSGWIQMNGLQGGAAINLFVTSKGVVYAVALTGIYRLAKDRTTWTLIDRSFPTFSDYVITEHGDTLYIATDRLYASTDSGGTWNVLRGILPRGYTTGFTIMDETQGLDSQVRTAMYLALLDKGVFRSTDMGKQWNPFNNGLTGKKIYALAAVKNTVFAGTNRGLYRLNASDVWEQLCVGVSDAIHALEVFENNLYVKTGRDLFEGTKAVTEVVSNNNGSSSRIFHSADLGASWTDITPEDESMFVRTATGIKLLPVGETPLTQDVHRLYSGDGEDAPINLASAMDLFVLRRRPFVAVDENTYYRAGIYGAHRTIDGGNSWHPFMKGMVGSGTLDLIVFNDHLYLHTYEGIYRSTDNGVSWEIVCTGYFGNSKFTIVGNVLYVIVNEWNTPRVLRLSIDGDELIPVQGIPDFDGETLVLEFWTKAHFEQLKQADLVAGRPVIKNVPATYYLLDVYGGKVGGFAVSGETFYIEYLRRLFKWKPGDSEWTNTGLVDTGKQPNSDLDNEFKLAVSAETVYVGKRDGRLFQSFDGGGNWRDLTSSLPLRFEHFKEIVFAGSTVYVATDKGVLGSQTGTHWHVITDKIGMPVVIDKFTVNNTEVFGLGDTGVYRLDDRGKWYQISPTVSDKTASLITSNDSTTQVAWEFDPPDTDRVVSLVADNNKLYVATYQLGIYQISLEKE